MTRSLVAQLLREGLAHERDPASVAFALQRWVQEHIQYLRESPETYATPRQTLAWRAGDCDDQVILLCATLRGVKIPCRAVFCGWAKGTDEIPFKHVYAQACLDGQWRTIETVKRVPPGWDACTEKARLGYRVRYEVVGDQCERAAVR